MSNSKIIDIRALKGFREAQEDPRFLAWLEYTDAALEIFDGFEKAPEVCHLPFDQEGLRRAEAIAVELWPDVGDAYTSEDVGLSQRIAYYIGEVFRRNFEGVWVQIPVLNSRNKVVRGEQGIAAIDLPFRWTFLNPNKLLRNGLRDRDGKVWSTTYGHISKNYHEWIKDGRPEGRGMVGLI